MKQDNKKEKCDKLISLFEKVLFIVFLYSACVFLTLYVRHAYFDMMEAKADVFNLVFRFLCPLGIILIFMKIILKRMKFSFFDCSLLLFLIVSSVSTIFSYSPIDAFSGEQGWHVGFFAISSLIVMVLSLKDIGEIDKRWFIPFIAVSFLEFFLAITDTMQADLLLLHAQIDHAQYYSFFSTLGNCNWCVGYYCLLVPLFACLYLSSENKYESIVFYFISLSGIIAAVLNGADGVYIGFAFGLFLILPCVLFELKRIRKAGFLLIGFAISLFLIKTGSVFSDFFVYYDSIGIIFFENFMMFSIALLGLSFILIGSRLNAELYEKRRKAILLIAESLFAVVMFSAVVFAMKYRGDSFDSYRFELWRLSFEQYSNYPLFNKIFGLGPELLRNVYSRLYSKYGIIFNSSHSEPVQILLTMGFAGLAAWLSCWITVGVRFIKTKAYEKKDICLYAGIVAYLGQSFVNSATLPNLCIFVLYVILVLKKEIE